MKKSFAILLLCAATMFAQAQGWNQLYREYRLGTSDATYSDGVLKSSVYRTYGTSDAEIRESVSIPLQAPIYEEYMMGSRCVKAGAAFITVGAAMSLIGGIVMATVRPETSSKGTTAINPAGIALISVGGTFITISLPLLTFGDHMKRDANWNYRLHKDKD